MCAECRQIPCHSRCPNAPEPTPVMVCRECKDGIFKGDKYFDTGAGVICENCMDEKSVSEILELCGDGLEIA